MTAAKCFVVGSSRSGTTLLTVLLDRHSQLAMTPETAFYRDLARQLDGADRDRAHELLAGWRRLPELGLTTDAVIAACDGDFRPGAVMAALLRLYATAHAKRFCGEKTPGHFRSVDMILADFPDTHILFMMRDGRDMALSLMAMPFWKADLAAAADQWRLAAAACRQALERYPDRVTMVRYEELATTPAAVLRGIMSPLGLGFEPGQLDPGIGSDVVLERSRAWKGRALTAVDTSRIGHWRTAASADEIAYLSRAMHDELEHFGYTA